MPPKPTTALLKKLRDVMKNTNYVCQNLQAYVIPSCDAHQSEYIEACDQRRAFISGFTGSDGTAIVTEKHAALWTDGRYFLQAEQELDENWILMKKDTAGTPTFDQFLADVLPMGSHVGVDPFLISYDSWDTLFEELKNKGHSLIPVQKNLIDVIWENRPGRAFNKIDCLLVKYTGKSWQEKVWDVQKEMRSKNASVLIVTALDEVAWLFNLRGSDIQFNPVFYSYAVITLNSVFLFIDPERLSLEAKASLESPNQGNIKFCSYDSIMDTLKNIINEKDEGKIWISEQASYALVSLIPEERRHLNITPISIKKAIKNEQEIESSRSAHIKDAVTLCEFYCWLSKDINYGNVTEIDAAKKLEDFKRLQDNYVGPSFETISSSGPNGAIIHYRPKEDTNRKITTEEIYLCDCGSQYSDGGTTDVTRTVHFGTPSAFEKVCYTLVLKGLIGLSGAIFPKFAKGRRLDSFARRPLWDYGLDYMHGTGHGVGAFLNVHEGPIGIHNRNNTNDPGLQAGMILSIEPGYYEDGKFGIRLENLALVKEIKTTYNFRDTGFLTFEPLTLVPFQTRLIDPSLLNDKEIKWLNEYHVACREVVGKILEEQGKTEALQWLFKETQPLG
ncbi:xaa-Pro aminopeptidase 1 [Nephila pilipes]|uniref:Xaa-Pro aminopeptidase 1 n=1 Tax=Nephila pilipes TaxID=299642 RepID=A0A8X6PNX2_NEPPI|nr:xaa-Pro aminopeptidase 1 [Nephila pilipes]